MSFTPLNQPSSNIQKAPEGKSKWVGHVEWACVFTVLFSAYLWYSSPIKTAAQFYFRLILLIAGVVGYLVIQVLKRSGSRDVA